MSTAQKTRRDATQMIIWRYLRDKDWKNIKEHGGTYRRYSTGVEELDPNHWTNKPKTDELHKSNT